MLTAFPKRKMFPESSVLMSLFATDRSCFPSPLKSPTEIDCGPEADGEVTADWNVPSPLPNNIAITLPGEHEYLPQLRPPSATARSLLPSPLKSPTAIERGAPPAGMSEWLPNVPSPLPNSTLTVLLPELAVARSSLPSLFISPAPTKTGMGPVE